MQIVFGYYKNGPRQAVHLCDTFGQKKTLFKDCDHVKLLKPSSKNIFLKNKLNAFINVCSLVLNNILFGEYSVPQ